MDDRDALRNAVVARLRNLLSSRGVTTASLERGLGRGRGYLADALRGDKRLTLETLGEILEFLDVSPETFFAGATGGYHTERDLGSEIAERGPSASWDCPCVRLARQFERLTKALEEAGVLDATTVARLREL
jgi:transcriptional regulator with XRE-family HTH domain